MQLPDLSFLLICRAYSLESVFVCAAKKDVEDLLKASGVTADSNDLDVLMSKLEGKALHELVQEGSKSLASMPAGGAPAAGGAAASAPAGEAPKKEEKAPEPEADVDMGDLFGGGDDDY